MITNLSITIHNERGWLNSTIRQKAGFQVENLLWKKSMIIVKRFTQIVKRLIQKSRLKRRKMLVATHFWGG